MFNLAHLLRSFASSIKTHAESSEEKKIRKET